MDDRRLGKKLMDKVGFKYAKVYRAVKSGTKFFYDKDYVTLSEKFAKEHAENNHVYHDEPHDVIFALIPTDKLYDAYNPGEYFYSGKPLAGKVIYTSLGPDEFEGFDENYEIEEQVRKIVSEEVKQIIEEDYDSIKEIEFLANEVVRTIAEKSLDYINLLYEDDGDLRNLRYLSPVKLNSVYVKFKEKFKKLSKFLESTKVTVVVKYRENNYSSGDYSFYLQKKYDSSLEREINLYFGEEFVKKINSYISDNLKGRNFEVADLFFEVHSMFFSSLKHEIQHAYDDYRSDSKMLQTKQFKEYIKNTKEEELLSKIESLDDIKSYLNLTHEVWARFTQTISEIPFTESSIEEMSDGHYYVLSTMKSLKGVLVSFYNKFVGWRQLFDSNGNLSPMQKRLQKAVVQFWHKEQERITKENKNPKLFY